jgi:hypothetical protein
MASIRIFNSAYRNSAERWVEMDEVNVVTMKMDYDNRPYILFEHRDYPLGALRAEFDGTYWQADMN